MFIYIKGTERGLKITVYRRRNCMIYFVSDLHFGHNNIREFEAPTRSHWDSVEEMNEGLIELWNNTITNNDIVYNIGDFFSI